jgi:hypothetical protein
MAERFDRFPELTELNAYRVRENLTYRALATQVGVAWRTLYGLLNASNPRPYDRTLYKIRRFLESRRPKSARRRTGEERAAS